MTLKDDGLSGSGAPIGSACVISALLPCPADLSSSFSIVANPQGPSQSLSPANPICSKGSGEGLG